MPNTSWLTDAITESVNEVIELLEEVFQDDDLGLGLLEYRVPQEILRQRFTEVAQAVDLREYERLSDEFAQDFGEDELQRQMKLAVQRKRRDNGRTA